MTTERMPQLNKAGMAFSDPNRVRAFMALRNGELCVCQLIELLKLAPSTVSKHMSVLKDAGLVLSRKDSRWVYYRIPDKDTGTFISALTGIVADYLERDLTIKRDAKAVLKITSMSLSETCK
ncbi:MAG: metalloregulator ArsR/SmtB family transcription factor [Chitinivibrionales bacterium]|nr:metalloregulator ArsR/SmtB family transcription factor [Chitinivibrionales bacterium]